MGLVTAIIRRALDRGLHADPSLSTESHTNTITSYHDPFYHGCFTGVLSPEVAGPYQHGPAQHSVGQTKCTLFSHSCEFHIHMDLSDEAGLATKAPRPLILQRHVDSQSQLSQYPVLYLESDVRTPTRCNWRPCWPLANSWRCQVLFCFG